MFVQYREDSVNGCTGRVLYKIGMVLLMVVQDREGSVDGCTR